MIRILLRVLGVLLALGAVYGVWRGIEAQEGMRSQDNEITKQESENRYLHRSAEEGEKLLTEPRQRMKEQEIESYCWFGGAAVGLIAGVGMALLPSSRKRKVPVAELAPAATADAPPPIPNPDERVTDPTRMRGISALNPDAPGQGPTP